MLKPPRTTELEFVRVTGNHAEFQQKLVVLGISAPDYPEHSKHVCTCWFALGKEHYEEGKAALVAKCMRAVYSRAYYAAYNASKAVRYLVGGSVSLKGDDHGKASSNLPDDFPDVASWSQKITTLYQHRLRADYDNWTTTQSENTLTPQEALDEAKAFIDTSHKYLNAKFGKFL